MPLEEATENVGKKVDALVHVRDRVKHMADIRNVDHDTMLPSAQLENRCGRARSVDRFTELEHLSFANGTWKRRRRPRNGARSPIAPPGVDPRWRVRRARCVAHRARP